MGISITILIIACPCSLILATPTAMVAAISASARLGILVKNVADLEIAGKMTAHSIRFILILLPMILIGILLGEWLHHRIDENRFKIFVFTVLFFAGLSICIS